MARCSGPLVVGRPAGGLPGRLDSRPRSRTPNQLSPTRARCLGSSPRVIEDGPTAAPKPVASRPWHRIVAGGGGGCRRLIRDRPLSGYGARCAASCPVGLLTLRPPSGEPGRRAPGSASIRQGGSWSVWRGAQGEVCRSAFVKGARDRPAASPAPTRQWRSGCHRRTRRRSCGKLALPVLLFLAVGYSRQVPFSLVTGAFGRYDPPPTPTRPAGPG